MTKGCQPRQLWMIKGCEPKVQQWNRGLGFGSIDAWVLSWTIGIHGPTSQGTWGRPRVASQRSNHVHMLFCFGSDDEYGLQIRLCFNDQGLQAKEAWSDQGSRAKRSIFCTYSLARAVTTREGLREGLNLERCTWPRIVSQGSCERPKACQLKVELDGHELFWCYYV